MEFQKVQKFTLIYAAEEAGVSLMTISLALRGHVKISKATSEKVRKAAKGLGSAICTSPRNRHILGRRNKRLFPPR